MSERVANSQRRAEVRCISRAQFSRANSAVIPKLRTSHLSIEASVEGATEKCLKP